MLNESNQRTISADSIKDSIRNNLIAKKIFAFEKLSSTNEFAKRLAADHANNGALIITEEQTRGRGRGRRKWYSPPGTGLWFSIILQPKLTPEKLGIVSILAAVSVAESIETVTTLRSHLKWPNDILINKKKACGILLETESIGNNIAYVVLGIGVNVNQSKEDFPYDLQKVATSLRIESDSRINRVDLLVEILHNLESNYQTLLAGDGDKIVNKWKEKCPFLQKEITIKQRGETLNGIFEDLDDKGSLHLRVNSREIRYINYGELI